MQARARSRKRVAGPHRAARPAASATFATSSGASQAPVKQTSGFGAGVLTNAEQEAAQVGFLAGRLASPWALFMVAALGYAVYEVVAAMFTAR